MFAIEKTASTISEWYTHYKNNNIDFEPPYQRVGSLWSQESQQLLIDSILNKLDVPKFYVNYFVSKGNILNPKEKLFAIIDGKQRFYAIFQFMEDNFPLSRNFELFDNPKLDLKGLTYSEISRFYPDFKHFFDNYKIDIALVITDEQERIEELFLRLNEGKQLNNAEKRYAISGDLSTKIKGLVNSNSFFNKVSFNDKRYDYFDVLTKLFLLDSQVNIVSLNKSNLDGILKSNRILTTEMKKKFKDFEENLKKFSDLFQENDSLFNSKSKIPLYYAFIRKLNAESLNYVYNFLTQFEKLILQNRVSTEKDETLIEYDRLTQQGTVSKSSLENRLQILQLYFDKFIENNEKLEVVKVDIEFDE
ncbi:DUF262 domain-containing protein [Ectobacillus sp. sgz5001026]|uniref:DUF262 domain-containing protein n=1 Tax=Ectobacillus sp. sgz5001026 TaxID=3242473 RepID=UPI0036D26CBD